ncbi:MAG: homoserine dehydrogenase [Pseudoxanthomonas sp.]|jgi:homoserine dehydrogenase|uniref:homoserine dehydrogenase n=1 Tax=Pseudoxanthomonas TaxID=83618 RepID=UPI001389DAB1|nr:MULTISPECIES: homoserine dehydrogenase [Pseudoxanthomonas]KAF1719452.1 homoserine dehydrogenase [Pseudoxanthomonas mexicana]MCH2090057.1 homoserine dehydrogenase [Pseudoxanthomonas sp.]
MSTVVPLRTAAYRAPRLALLGTGVVGSALVARYQRLQSAGLALPPLAWLANSRALHDCAGAPQRALEEANGAAARRDDLTPWAEAEALHAGDIVIDATASDAVAGWHAEWLSRGVHVVTANKLGAGSGWSRAQAIAQACAASGARYGDAATVGAGLPLLRSLRALVAGGDRIHRVEGVLSGSLAWLFNHYDGMRPFSGFVRQARQAGYTEPDPRIDLSGEDVRRKLLILARAAGLPLDQADVRVESLVPAELAALPPDSVDGALAQLDAPVAARFKEAYRNGGLLRFVGRFDRDRASVGLQVLPEDHPLCGGSGTDNRVAIYSDRYDEQPLVVQGPGAGAGITAAALLDDVLAIATAR